MRLIQAIILRERTRPTVQEAEALVQWEQLKVPGAGDECVCALCIANKTSEQESFEDFCQRVVKDFGRECFQFSHFFVTHSASTMSGEPAERTFVQMVWEKDQGDLAAAYQTSPEVQIILDVGQRLETHGDWTGAWKAYWTGLKQFPQEAHLVLRCTRLLFHPNAGERLTATEAAVAQAKRNFIAAAWDASGRLAADVGIATALGDTCYYESQTLERSVLPSLQTQETSRRLKELAYLQYARAVKLSPADAAIRERYLELCRTVSRSPEDSFFS